MEGCGKIFVNCDTSIIKYLTPDDEEDIEILTYALDKSLYANKNSQIRAIVRILSAKTKNK